MCNKFVLKSTYERSNLYVEYWLSCGVRLCFRKMHLVKLVQRNLKTLWGHWAVYREEQ
jgi:hypothetical protein